MLAGACGLGAALALAALLCHQQLKMTLIGRAAERLTGLIGQKVSVGDAMLGPAGLCIYGLAIDDAAGTGAGKLLEVQSICADISFRALARGSLVSRKIAVESPRLRIARDAQGRLNVSDKLLAMLRERGTIDYRVALVEVSDGEIVLNLPGRYDIRGISVAMKDLSSHAGAKSSFAVSSEVPGVGAAGAEGWFVLDNGLRNVTAALSGRGLSLAGIAALAGRDLPDRKIDLSARAEGDMSRGMNMTAEIDVHEGSVFAFFPRRDKLRARAEALWDRAGDSLKVAHAEVSAGDKGLVRLSGTVRQLSTKPLYDVVMQIPRFDLSALPVKKGQSLGGELSSDGLAVRGRADGAMPALDGGLRLKNGAWTSPEAVLGSIEADVSFLPAANAAHATITAEAARIGGITFARPVVAAATADVERGKGNFSIRSAVLVTGVDAEWTGKRFLIEKAALSMDAGIAGSLLSGRLSLDAGGVLFREQRYSRVAASGDVSVKKDEILLKGLAVDADRETITASALTAAPGRGTGGYSIRVTGLRADLPREKASVKGMNGSIDLYQGGGGTTGDYSVSAEVISYRGVAVKALSSAGRFSDKAISSALVEAEIAQGKARVSLRSKSPSAFFPLDADVSLSGQDAAALSEMMVSTGVWQAPYRLSGTISRFSFLGTVEGPDSVQGKGELTAERFGLAGSSGRVFVRDIGLQADAVFAGSELKFRAETRAQNVRLTADGTMNRFSVADRSGTARIILQEAGAQDLRTAFWDIFPDRLLYAGLDGMIAAEVGVVYDREEIRADGNLVIRDLMVEGENGEFTLGPVNGTVPLVYRSMHAAQDMAQLQGFDRESFGQTLRRFSAASGPAGKPSLTIATFRYGFRLVDDIGIWLRPENGLLNVDRFSATIFGGKAVGIARIALSEQPEYRIGFIVDNLSLMSLCDEVAPIRGYLSGRISGIGLLRGSGVGLSRLTGRTDFWTHETKEEKTRISREFLEKVGGPSVRAYLGERPFNRGVMSLYIQDGFLTFRELEISNRNLLGVQDLSVKVAPLSNRISIDHLLWTIVQAAERAQANK
ncbi:MAG: hypothetical protein OHK006_03530 [Thermodesulfovibrionales bacterium]